MLIFSLIAFPISSFLSQFQLFSAVFERCPLCSNVEPTGQKEFHSSHTNTPDRKTSAKDDSHLLPLSLHLATNRGDFRLCSGQAATLDLICEDLNSDDDFSVVIYSWQVPILSYEKPEFDFDICSSADSTNSSHSNMVYTVTYVPSAVHV